jgi:peptidyl-prolyl cis-trans isomerase B (cyclophilin B)
MTYPQQQPYGQYPPQQYPPPQFPGYPQPPKKGNGLLIGLLAGGVGLLLVVVFVITAFVAPGFLVSHRSKGPSTPPLDLNSGSVAAGKFMLAVMGSPDDAGRAACAADRSQIVGIARRASEAGANLSAGEPVKTLDDQMTVHLSGTADGGRPVTIDLTVKRETDGSYCISSATSSF